MNSVVPSDPVVFAGLISFFVVKDSGTVEVIMNRQQRRAAARARRSQEMKDILEMKRIAAKLEELKPLIENGRHNEPAVSQELGRLIERPNFIIGFIRYAVWSVAKEILSSETLRIRCLKDPYHSFVRTGKISLEQLFIFLLCLAGGDLNREVYEYFKYKFDIPSASAMVQRRALLLPEGMEYFFGRMTEIMHALCGHLEDGSRLPFAVLAADGTDVNIFLNPESATHVSASNSAGWNQFHVNLLYDVFKGTYAAVLIQDKTETHETRAAAHMLRNTEFPRRVLITYDRGYASLNLIETMNRLENVEYLIRCKETFIKEIRDLPLKELDRDIRLHIITTQTNSDKKRVAEGKAKYLSGVSKFGKYKKSQAWDFESEVDMVLRVVRFQLPSGKWETLITSLKREEFRIDELRELYRLRWDIEKSIRHLKYDTCLAVMHCRKETYAKQEVWAKVTMHNIISAVMKIAERYDVQEKETRHELKINRRFAAHVITDSLKNQDIQTDIISEIIRHKGPVRNGRAFKRVMRGIGFRSFLYR